MTVESGAAEARTGKRVALIGSLTSSLVNFRGPLIAALVDAGHQVFAFAPDDDPGSAQRVAELGGTFVRYELQRAGTDPVSDLRTMVDLTRKLRARRIDVAITYTIKPNIYGNYAAWLARVPHIYSLITGLGFAFTQQPGRGRRALLALTRRMLKLSLATNERVIVYNEDIRETYERLGLFTSPGQAVRIGGTGVDLTMFEPSEPGTSPLRFLLIARLLADKGIREYAEAARMLKAEHPDVRFELLGPTDPNPAALTVDEVRGWHDAGIVHWHGETDDVRPYLRDCSVFVLPSYAEGVPRSTQEAMATGRAVVTTRAPGCRDTVEQGVNGFLVPVGDAQALADAMRRFIETPELAITMGRASRALVEERFDVVKINQRLLETMGLDA